jgi:hypothetical protein
MKTAAPARALCPKCGGKVFIDRDRFGAYEHCIQCGYLHDLTEGVEAQAISRDNPKR